MHCEKCKFYDPVDERILIIKLGADGDVLRTTCLLPALKTRHPRAHITWLTEASAEPLLRNHPSIDRIWAPPERFLPGILVETFDLVINPDADSLSCWLAKIVTSENKRGFMAGLKRNVIPLSESAENWFLMGLSDDVKRGNRRSYPEIIYDIVGMNEPIYGSELFLTDIEASKAEQHLLACGWRREQNRPVVGVNTGAGHRWPQKSLPIETLEKLIEGLLQINPLVDIFLLGGPKEIERNSYLAERFAGRLIDAGVDNTIRHFAAIISHTDILMTADTLAMHIGIALKKYVVAHFGPTSPWEIDLYGNGKKIIPELDCICCYLNACTRNPSCSELVEAEDFLKAVNHGLEVCKMSSS